MKRKIIIGVLILLTILLAIILSFDKVYYNKLSQNIDYKNYVWSGCKDKSVVWIEPNLKCTGSMKPTFSCENTLYFCKHVTGDLHVGDIVAYKYDDYLVVHRIIGVTNDGFLMKGDHNKYPDAKVVRESDIVGKLYRIDG